MAFAKVEDFFAGSPAVLTDADFQLAAKRLGLTSTAGIRAVAQVESGGQRGFYPDGLMVVLDESHIFNKYTNGKYKNKNSAKYPQYTLSTTARAKNKYAPAKPTTLRYELICERIALDETAALKAASWGMFQVMGFNHRAVGYGTVQEMITDFMIGEGPQLRAFTNFIFANNIDDELRANNWKAFAAVYNGAAYAVNKYDVKMANAYAKYYAKYGDDVKGAVAAPPPTDTSIERLLLGRKGPQIVKLQTWLNKATKANILVDGVYGNRTMLALRSCRWTQDVMRKTLMESFGISV